MQLSFVNGLASSEFTVGETDIQINASAGFFTKSSNPAFESHLKELQNFISSYQVEVENETLRKKDNVFYKNIEFVEKTNSKSLDISWDQFIKESIINIEASEMLSKIGALHREKNTLSVPSSNIIDSKKVIEKESEEAMCQKLVNHRNLVEKYGFLASSAIGIVTLIPPALSLVDWAVTVPPAIMLFSLSATILLRKNLRRSANDSSRN